ncbi:hypothetical protein Vadar_028828 [Vaccinium darrowii]|uniref:Uncharacterized protein n=1 Tax=Vaccinium darrowii TaxID=229202 RepID=A0ACB7Y2H2_9ERIC|nr:hypothetical protein Vadar_028828 [Vaccinium darrowii]
MMDKHNGGFHGRRKKNVFTVFVDNLPKEMDKIWLHQIFRSYGQVDDIYIPVKRSARFNTKFGFIRFLNSDEALKAVNDLDGIIIRDFKLQVNLAKYTGNSRTFPGTCKSAYTSVQKTFSNDTVCIGKDFRSCTDRNMLAHKIGSPSFADVVANRFQNNPDSLIVQATEEGKDWLDRSAVGWLPSLRSVESLMDAFIAEGIYNIQLRDMGGKLVLLTFASVEDMTSMLEEAGLCWLRNWFEDVKRWSPNLKLDNKRADSVNKDRGFRSSVVEDSEDYESALEKGEDVDVSGNKEDTFAIANKDDQAKLSTPSSINQISERSIHVEEYKEASQAEGNSFKDVAGTDFPTFSSKDVVSACDETPSYFGIQDVEVDPLLSRPPLFASDDSISVAKEAATIALRYVILNTSFDPFELVSTENFVQYL